VESAWQGIPPLSLPILQLLPPSTIEFTADLVNASRFHERHFVPCQRVVVPPPSIPPPPNTPSLPESAATASFRSTPMDRPIPSVSSRVAVPVAVVSSSVRPAMDRPEPLRQCVPTAPGSGVLHCSSSVPATEAHRPPPKVHQPTSARLDHNQWYPDPLASNSNHIRQLSSDRFTSVQRQGVPIHIGPPPSARSLYQMLPTRAIGTSRAGEQLDPLVEQDTQQDLIWQSIGDNVQAMVANKVIPSSQRTYASGWRRWHTYTALIDTDIFLTRVSPGYTRFRAAGTAFCNLSFCIMSCIGFIAYLINHPTKWVIADTAIKYLTGTRYYLTRNGIDCAFMDNSSFVKAARAGAQRAFRMEPGNSVADHQTLPVSVGMLEIICGERLDKSILQDHALMVALFFAYSFLCRISEYVQRPESHHHLLSDSVVFWIAHSSPIDVTPDRPYLLIPSPDVWRYDRSRLLGVNVTIKDSKNDPGGVGRKNPRKRFSGPRPTSMVYDISELLYDLAVVAKPLPGEPFFSTSLPNVPYRLSADRMNDFLRDILAPRFGLNPNRIHSHSLRFAGASALRAGGVEDSVIMIMGGWKSLAFLGYIKLAQSAFDQVAAALSNRDLFSVQDVRNLMPGINF
jgi:hypothetical protein